MFILLWQSVETISQSCTNTRLSDLAKACCLRGFVMKGPKKKNKGSKSFVHCDLPLNAEVLICMISKGQTELKYI